MLLVIIGGVALVFCIGYVVGAKITDEKHGVYKHFWEY